MSIKNMEKEKGGKKVILLRHGESIGNIRGVFQGQSIDLGLTQRGISQIRRANKNMKIHNPDMIISSDLKRASESARQISCEFSIPVEESSFLREVNFGKLEGTVKKNFDVFNKELKSYIKNHNYSFDIVGGEGIEDIYRRVEGTIGLIEGIDCRCVVLVSHKSFIIHFLQYHKIIEKKITIDNGDFIELFYKEKTLKMY